MMDDRISRQAAIDALCDNCDNAQAVCPHYPCKQYTAIDALPSAQPENVIMINKETVLQAGYQGREVDFRIGGRLFAIREKAQ